MEGHLEALLEMDFCTKLPNFRVETHMEAPAGDALRKSCVLLISKKTYQVKNELISNSLA
jgi:hypothetical protein